ncbi:MAG: TIGR04372 family glycosyltransferase [Lentisphaerae bacterium]|nr:TIGR04372 family glycosyltransferase [Lentisphaerota bacterium]
MKIRGHDLLRDLGIDGSRWYVCLHVREAGWVGDHERLWKNQDILNYLPMIDYIGSLGGYVVRMGDDTMTPMPERAHLIDYARSRHRSGFADLYLCSTARVFIGCHSGLRTLPSLFNTPTVSVNVWPLSPLDFHERHLTIFSTVFSKPLGRPLALEEVLSDPSFCYRSTDTEYEASDWRIQENTAEDILEAVREMLGIVDRGHYGVEHWSPEQVEFQAQLQTALRTSPFVRTYGDTMFYPDALCRTGSSYLRRYKCSKGRPSTAG